MFWGLIMEPGRCYTQTVKISFHVSMAALDISNSCNEPAQVMCVFEGRNYLLCTLNKEDKVQCSLDLNFEAGSKVSFATNGKAHVHLTGYLLNTDEDDLRDEDDEEEEVEEEEKNVLKKKKRLIKKESTEEPPNKKTKTMKNNLANVEAEEEEDSSDTDFDIDHLMNANEGEEASEEDDDEEEEAEEEEDEDASSLSGEEEESEEEEEEKPKQNGVAQTKINLQQKKNKEQKPQEKVPKGKPVKQEEKKQQKPKKAVLKGGVHIEDLKEGSGDPVKEGKLVNVYYEGRLKGNNKLFDATTKGPGFKFRLGKGDVIKGWDIGLVGMKVGGKRRITCPPKVAYGAQGSPPAIPPNATLVFDVELKKIG